MKICKVLCGISLIVLQGYFADFALAATCDFRAPTPILLPHAYAGQTLHRKPLNGMAETAQLPDGSQIEISQSACVDVITTAFALMVPLEQGTAENHSALVELLRQTILALKTRPSAPPLAELDVFLGHSNSVPLHDGTRSMCRDGSKAPSGECAWESTGGYVLSVKPVGRSMRVSVIQYVSG
ncbi:hypothetical protein [Massilia sp. PWRC2]|uniref:hypothetical protein n=1 Tax=Massilia sp. PWRC2 TaxID=2804626 RepID=UPI003CF603FC